MHVRSVDLPPPCCCCCCFPLPAGAGQRGAGPAQHAAQGRVGAGRHGRHAAPHRPAPGAHAAAAPREPLAAMAAVLPTMMMPICVLCRHVAGKVPSMHAGRHVQYKRAPLSNTHSAAVSELRRRACLRAWRAGHPHQRAAVACARRGGGVEPAGQPPQHHRAARGTHAPPRPALHAPPGLAWPPHLRACVAVRYCAWMNATPIGRTLKAPQPSAALAAWAWHAVTTLRVNGWPPRPWHDRMLAPCKPPPARACGMVWYGMAPLLLRCAGLCIRRR